MTFSKAENSRFFGLLSWKPVTFSFLLGVCSCLIFGCFQFPSLAAQKVLVRISIVGPLVSVSSVSFSGVTFGLSLKRCLLELQKQRSQARDKFLKLTKALE